MDKYSYIKTIGGNYKMSKIKELYRKYEQVIMYIIMGGCTTLVYYIVRIASRLLLGEINKASLIATAIAQIAAITFAFITNKKFVFKSKTSSGKELAREAVAFYAGRAVTFVLDLLITFVFVETCADFFVELFRLDKLNYDSGILGNKYASKLVGTPLLLNEFIWTMLSQVMILILNYIFSKLVVFKKGAANKEQAEN